jgi:endoglucanase
VFVSEWGTSRADGSGGVFPRESDVWLSFLEERGISWCNWSLGDRDETSAALKPGSPENWSEADLTESGRYVYGRLGGIK